MELKITNSTKKSLYCLVYGLSDETDDAHYGYVDPATGRFVNWTTTGSKLDDFTEITKDKPLTIATMPTIISKIILLYYNQKPYKLNIINTKQTK